MCRLLGYVARRPTSVVEVLGQEHFDAFTALTAVHGDGWGMAWWDPDSPTVRSVTSAGSAIHDLAYSRLAGQRLGRAGIVHLRWATPGLAVSPQNTHPFVDGGYAFAHNGHIAPLGSLEGLLTREARATLRGDTDSERYFRFVMQCIAERGDDTEGLRQALGVLTSEFPEASLNALLMTPAQMFGVHINSQASVPIKGLRNLFPSEEEIPYRHTEDYFAMDYRSTPDATHVISSGIDPEGWTPVPEDTAAMVDLGSLEVTRLDLPGRR
ncbi:class II glutamine amidotransferase [Nocardioides sp. HM23]|uniref:class II glutamine amidotransferase n=1 Tax=Nocardioides bizhenqiangii TaxID=3095076 RepID=UPI002ACADD0A|nr:class II glutamine amidotransferase [Nocardioides sp. HM23]MDZ5622249.1 class II glutamine amidotransferase [Nocardioides sp. HM23]